ncbi:hypothetical protein [Actinocrispum sp. NPDC049592]|uniref:hypothetical protein n=1 Tax=Actinocrispum sp. NPDC049592 TaxID=3154835 RepID=UPI00342110BD
MPVLRSTCWVSGTTPSRLSRRRHGLRCSSSQQRSRIWRVYLSSAPPACTFDQAL